MGGVGRAADPVGTICEPVGRSGRTALDPDTSPCRWTSAIAKRSCPPQARSPQPVRLTGSCILPPSTIPGASPTRTPSARNGSFRSTSSEVFTWHELPPRFCGPADNLRFADRSPDTSGCPGDRSIRRPRRDEPCPVASGGTGRTPGRSSHQSGICRYPTDPTQRVLDARDDYRRGCRSRDHLGPRRRRFEVISLVVSRS